MAYEKWITEGFEAFRKGIFGNGGQNLYVSRSGILQRIHRFDTNQNGYFDLLFVNSQDFDERPPAYVYDVSLDEKYELPTQGSYAAVTADLNGNGYDDLILANQCNGHISDIAAYIYWGSKEGFSEKYKLELPTPDSLAVAVGDFNGDGRMDIAFASAGKLRIFYQKENGFAESNFKDIDLAVTDLAAADLDGDGYCDLYVRLRNGKPHVLWGSKDGITAENMICVGGEDERLRNGVSSTPGWREYENGWSPKVIVLKGKQYLFRQENNQAVFYIIENRQAVKSFSLPCEHAVAVAVGDIFNRNKQDLVCAVNSDISRQEKSMIFFETDNGYGSEKTEFLTQNARDICLYDLNQNGCLDIIVCQGRTSKMNTCASLVYEVDDSGIKSNPREIETHDAVAALVVRNKDTADNIVFVNHATGNYLGNIPAYLYIGDEDGYSEERRVELPGWSAPTALVCDFYDTGFADALIVNCAENAPHVDPGAFMYKGGRGGIQTEVSQTLKNKRPHGAAVGDFRHTGYLDIAFAGINNPLLTIFEGGPNGYSNDRVQKIMLDPNLDVEDFIVDERLGGDPDNPGLKWLQTRYMTTADLNNNGWLDLILPLSSNTCSMILWGGPDGFSRDNITLLEVEGACSVQVADLSGNGYPDLIFGSYQSISKKDQFDSSIYIYWGGPDGFSEFKRTQLPSHSSVHMVIADFNNNGNLDIYTNSYKSSRDRDLPGYIYWGAPNGHFSVERRTRLFGHSGSGCVAADLNENGYMDLVVAHHKTYGNHTGESKIWWNGPDGFSEQNTTKLPTLGPHGMYEVNAGNIMDRSDEEFYISSAYELPGESEIFSIGWDAELQMKTWVKAQIRTALTLEELDDSIWQGPDGSSDSWFKNGQVINGFTQKGSWVQYKLTLGAKNCGNSPRIKKVTVNYKSK